MADVGGTLVALILVPIVVAIVAIAVGGIFVALHLALTVIRPEIIGFVAACLGGGVGVVVARAASDVVLRGYAPRVVFAELVLLCGAGLVAELTLLPMTWERVAPIAQLIVIGVTAYGAFWRVRAGEPVR